MHELNEVLEKRTSMISASKDSSGSNASHNALYASLQNGFKNQKQEKIPTGKRRWGLCVRVTG